MRELAGARLFITGGTGFFGKWLLESLAYANDVLGCDIRATILTRNPQRFLTEEMPHLKNRAEFSWMAADVTQFDFPAEAYDYILHLATFTSAHVEKTEPLEMLTAKFLATRRVLDFARHCNACRVLVTSSGAVYGPQPPTLERIPEDYQGAPDPLLPSSAYGNGKRMVEQLCAIAPDVDSVIARCFSFLGPHLPLDARYAAGNFLRDAMAGGPIIIHSDGLARRSYLHPADLVIWLLTLLLRGKKGKAYNVGSDEAVTVKELANQIAAMAPNPIDVHIEDRTSPPAAAYVPSIEQARAELGLDVVLTLPDAVHRAVRWLHGEN
ncbi:MAG TPA: NAD(P)-dependent oxidoreductase [Rhodocyclaceae bacterium]|nr:NAD(P)-dependent oxidoreductase [Rhodocyclaceae bacterium]